MSQSYSNNQVDTESTQLKVRAVNIPIWVVEMVHKGILTMAEAYAVSFIDGLVEFGGIGCWASNARLAKQFGMTDTGVSLMIKRLVQKKVVVHVGSVMSGNIKFRLLETAWSRIMEPDETKDEADRRLTQLVQKKGGPSMRVELDPEFMAFRRSAINKVKGYGLTKLKGDPPIQPLTKLKDIKDKERKEDIKEKETIRPAPSAAGVSGSPKQESTSPPKESPSAFFNGSASVKKTRAGRFHDQLKARQLITCSSPCETKTHDLKSWEKEFIGLENDLVSTFNLTINKARDWINQFLEVYPLKYGIIKYLPKMLNGRDVRAKFVDGRNKLIEAGCLGRDDDEDLMGDYMEPQVKTIKINNPGGTVTHRLADEELDQW